MVLKIQLPLVIKACPEVTVNRELLSQEIQVINTQFFFIRAVVADSHSANVNAFNILLDKFEEDIKYYITM